MTRRVIKDLTTGLYFKSNPSGWEGKWLKKEKIVWVASVKKAGRYSMSENDTRAIKSVIECLEKLFGHKLEVETYRESTQWIKL